MLGKDMTEQPVNGFFVEVSSTRHWIRLIHQFLNTFGWLGDAFVLDFHVKNHWKCLPNSWQEFLPSLTPEELGVWLDPRVSCSSGYTMWGPSVMKKGHVPPLGLSAFKESVRLLSLNRGSCKMESEKAKSTSAEEFKNLFKRHVKPKKLHEIERFCRVVTTLTTKTYCQQVFDVGSGLGHLARFLTYGCQLSLTCVDCNDTFGESATKFDRSIEQFLQKKDLEEFPQAPLHICVKLEMNKHEKHFQCDCNFGIVGLHSCGNLSPVIVHNFVNSPAKFVVSVGCCYMKLDDSGFPLSGFCRDAKIVLTYESLEVACHALEQYCQNLRDGLVSKLMPHAYRATLETILIDNFGIVRAGLRGVRHCERISFQEYALQAVKDLPNITLSQDLLESDEIDYMVNGWYKVVLFYSLRLLVSTVVETLIILDRSLFIKEKVEESTVKIVPIFDPFISPRNLAIVAEKNVPS